VAAVAAFPREPESTDYPGTRVRAHILRHSPRDTNDDEGKVMSGERIDSREIYGESPDQKRAGARDRIPLDSLAVPRESSSGISGIN